MHRSLIQGLGTALAIWSLLACAGPQAPAPEKQTAAIQALLAQEPDFLTRRPGLEKLLNKFYAPADAQTPTGPVWVKNAQVSSPAEDLLQALRKSADHGLNPADYQASQLRKQVNHMQQRRQVSAEQIANLDVRLSFAFMRLATDLHAGRIDPKQVDPKWISQPSGADYVGVMRDAIGGNAVAAALENLAPHHREYRQLKQALAAARKNIGKDTRWPGVSSGDVLEVGDESPRVLELRKRLAASGLIDEPDADARNTNVYDQALADAVKTFQRHHGLQVDGLLGPGTIAALNVSPQSRVRQIELNLERWRWLPRNLGDRYVLVNVPDYRVFAFEGDEKVLDMRVIVGKEYNDQATPIFTDTMQYVVFRPYWNIPHSIAAGEILPKARKDLGYLAQKNYEIVADYSVDARTYPVTRENLARVAAEELRLRERPGPTNSLGLVKFLFPNNYAVYLHDTPADSLFAKDKRALSHGCIRLERPADFASFVFSRQPEWTDTRIRQAMHQGQRQSVDLDEPIPVYILYWTAIADENGKVAFRPDLYDFDSQLDQALQQAQLANAN